MLQLTEAKKELQSAQTNARNARTIADHAAANKLKAVNTRIDSEMRAVIIVFHMYLSDC